MKTLLKATVALAVLALALALAPLMPEASAQTTPTPAPILVLGTSDDEQDEQARISFPPPVYVVRDRVAVRGSANAPGMTSYFLEVLSLKDFPDPTDPDAIWTPATLPSNRRVEDGILGEWDTRLIIDGLYALRLTLNVTGQGRLTHLISPLRVENEPPPFVVVDVPPVGRPEATPTLAVITRPTLAPTPTQFSALPRVTATTDANVRRGDNVNTPRVGVLLAGQSADVIGRSPEGWYYIQLPTGGRGFISPVVVNFSGNAATLQLVFPPATPTPVPTNTPVPTGNLLINGHGLVPEDPRCNEPFQVQANITNNGSARTLSGGVVQLQNFHAASNTLVTTATATFPPMDPGQNFVVVFNILVSSFPRENHRVVLTIDPNNQIPEENEADNTYTFSYRLRAGGCP